MITNELLRRYAADGSESAFTELVRQHIDLVYSAALRQVQGDTGAAQDVTQAVFTDLARKAPRLAGHTSLTGWLYTSARFQAAKTRRADQRRRIHEEESHAMNQLLQANDSSETWREMRPVLDDVMHELNDKDREAVLLRFFERKPLAEIGTHLGLSENAARMRVDRALEKLRAALSKRGVTSTVAALALVLTEQASIAAPATLIGDVSKSALAAAAVGGAAGVATLTSLSLKWLAAAAAVVILGVVVWNHHDSSTSLSKIETSQSPAVVAQVQTQTQNPTTPTPTPTTVVAAPLSDNTNKLTLHIVTADTGQPIPSVDLDYWVWGDGTNFHKAMLHADRFGVCEVPVNRSTVTKLILVSERNGFADTRLQWHTDQGEKIPDEYNLRLPRAVPISGTVVDADGNPVAGAKIGVGNRPGAQTTLPNETSNFEWPFWVETESDATGHWHIDRIAKEALRTLDMGADHPDHLRVDVPESEVPQAMEQWVAGTYVFHLGRAIQIQGTVTDLSGAAVPGARVRAGYAAVIGMRETKTAGDGTFTLSGCKPEKMPLSADAKGFATTTIEVDLATNQSPFHLTIKPGKMLRIRIVDYNGTGVGGVYVFYDNMPKFNGPEINKPAIQADFEKKTDADGRVEWTNAPDAELHFSLQHGNAHEFDIHVRPDGEEHVIKLSRPASPLTLFGSVTDSSTGKLLPSFRVIEGWPVTNYATSELGARWSTIDRFWLKFDGGAYRHEFDETPLMGNPNPGFVFKFEAEGYAPFVSRPYGVGEGENKLDVALDPATPTSITVLSPDGSPAARADVALVSPGSGLMLKPGGFSRDNLQSAETLFSTDREGRLSVFVDASVKQIVVAHPQGFAQTSVAGLSSNTTIQLQPWSRIEGTLSFDGQPASNREIRLGLGNNAFDTLQTDFQAYKFSTDSDGKFVIPQAPPGNDSLVLLVPNSMSPGRIGWMHRPLTNFDLSPGETLTINATIPAGTPMPSIQPAASASVK